MVILNVFQPVTKIYSNCQLCPVALCYVPRFLLKAFFNDSFIIMNCEFEGGK